MQPWSVATRISARRAHPQGEQHLDKSQENSKLSAVHGLASKLLLFCFCRLLYAVSQGLNREQSNPTQSNNPRWRFMHNLEQTQQSVGFSCSPKSMCGGEE